MAQAIPGSAEAVMPDAPASALARVVADLIRLQTRRRWALRCLVLAFASAIITALPLLGLATRIGVAIVLSFPILWAGYLLIDSGLVAAWRRRTMRKWRTGALNLGVFADAVATLPALGRATQAAMLDGLPVLSPTRDRDLALAERSALAALADQHYWRATASALFPATLLGSLSAFVGLQLSFAIVGAAGAGLALVGLVAFLMAMRLGMAEWHRRQVAACCARLPASEHAAMRCAARALGWLQDTSISSRCISDSQSGPG
jgi:hypothetical protein